MLRLNNYSEPFTEYKLSDLFEKSSQKNKDGSVSNVLTNSAQYGLISQRDFFDKDIANKDNSDGYYVVNNGDFVYNPRKSSTAPFGPFNCYQGAELGIVSPLYTVLHPKTVLNVEYLMYLFASPCWHKYVYMNGDKGARFDRVSIKTDVFMNMPVNLPSEQEQAEVADCLSSVDAVIADYEAQVENMQNQKKGVMQKLFSQEVRFKADDGSEYSEWIEFTFIDGFEIMKNNTLSRDCLNYESGKVKNIHYGDVLIKFGALKNVTDEDVPFINDGLDVKGNMLLNGDVVFADTAEDTTAGKATEIIGLKDYDAVSGLHTIPCRPKEKHAEGFLGYYFNSYSYRKQLLPLMQGTKVTSINRKNIEESKVCMPCLEEQQKIADCLSAFDTAIEDLQKTVEHWKNIKKGLLQQLFA